MSNHKEASPMVYQAQKESQKEAPVLMATQIESLEAEIEES